MKIYEISDFEENLSIGVLIYYEKSKDFVIELRDNLDEWTAPLICTHLVKEGIYTMPRDVSYLWVKERVIPNDRQNISDILRNYNLEAYDELKLLELSNGRCSQDSLCIRKINDLPEFVLERRNNIVDCVACSNNRILLFFEDKSLKRIDLNEIANIEGVSRIIANERLYASVKVGTGGYCITFDDAIDIPAHILYNAGESIPLAYEDFLCFARNNIVDTTECCITIDCSRQNISYMIRNEQLCPIKRDIKGNLFLKKDVNRNLW